MLGDVISSDGSNPLVDPGFLSQLQQIGVTAGGTLTNSSTGTFSTTLNWIQANPLIVVVGLVGVLALLEKHR